MLRTSDAPFPLDPVTVCAAAALVGVSRKTISRRLQQGHLRCWLDRVTGRSLRLSRAEVLGLWRARVPAGYKPPRFSTRRREAEMRETARRLRERLGMPPG